MSAAINKVKYIACDTCTFVHMLWIFNFHLLTIYLSNSKENFILNQISIYQKYNMNINRISILCSQTPYIATTMVVTLWGCMCCVLYLYRSLFLGEGERFNLQTLCARGQHLNHQTTTLHVYI